MSLKKSFILALVLGVALLLIREVELPRDDAKRRSESLVAGAAASELTSITISKGAEVFVLRNEQPTKEEKAGDSQNDESGESEQTKFPDYSHWRLYEGDKLKDAQLDSGALGGLLAGLTAVKLEKPIPSSERENDLGVYGLATPLLTVELEGPFGKRRVLFGKRSDYTLQRYFKLDDSDDLYLGSDYSFDQSNRTSDDLRSKNRIALELSKVKSIRLESSKGSMLIDQEKPDVWKIAGPTTLEAEANAVSELVRNLQALRVKEFLDDATKSVADYGLDKPDVSITVVSENGNQETTTRARLRVVEGGSPRMYLALSDSPPFFLIEGNTISHYLLTPREVRIKEPFKFDYYDVTELQISSGEENGKELLKLAKAGLDWTVNQKAGDPPFINEYLRSLTGIKASDFPGLDETFDPGPDELVMKVVTGGVVAQEKEPASQQTRIYHISREFQRKGVAAWYVREEGKNLGMFIGDGDRKNLVAKVESLLKVDSPAPAASVAANESSPENASDDAIHEHEHDEDVMEEHDHGSGEDGSL